MISTPSASASTKQETWNKSVDFRAKNVGENGSLNPNAAPFTPTKVAAPPAVEVKSTDVVEAAS